MSIRRSAVRRLRDRPGPRSPAPRRGADASPPPPSGPVEVPRALRRGICPVPLACATRAPGVARRLLVLPVLALLLGCGVPSARTEATTGRPLEKEPGRVLVDEVGRRVRVPQVPRRIVSLAPSVTETLFALGAGGRVVGVTDFCDYPAGARSKARVGGMVNPNWEVILRLDPDLLVATTAGNDRSVATRAEQLRLPIFFLDVPDLQRLQTSMKDLGDLVASPEAARILLQDFARRLQTLERRVSRLPRQKVLFLVWGEPIVAPGRGTFLDDALRRAGCDSVTSDGPPGWPTFSLETLVTRSPRWILGTEQNAAFLRGLDRRAGWKEMEAVRRGRIGVVSLALERPGPRVIEAMEQLRALLGRE